MHGIPHKKVPRGHPGLFAFEQHACFSSHLSLHFRRCLPNEFFPPGKLVVAAAFLLPFFAAEKKGTFRPPIKRIGYSITSCSI
jgi:hypothetical protein